MRSKGDAKRWVQRAKNFYGSVGKRFALAEFSNPTGPFIEDSMYIFVLSPKGTMLAHGINEKLVGHENLETVDPEGKPFVKDIVKIANNGGAGWVEYKWMDPITQKWLQKSTYVERVDEVIICCGVYDYSPLIYQGAAF